MTVSGVWDTRLMMHVAVMIGLVGLDLVFGGSEALDAFVGAVHAVAVGLGGAGARWAEVLGGWEVA